jgi:hypothetical protein
MVRGAAGEAHIPKAATACLVEPVSSAERPRAPGRTQQRLMSKAAPADCLEVAIDALLEEPKSSNYINSIVFLD